MKKLIISIAVILVTVTTINGQTLELIKEFNNRHQGHSFVKFNNKVLFLADDSISGIELRVSDGTLMGTQVLKDINVGVYPNFGALHISNYLYINYHGILNNELYFNGIDTANGIALWKTDGTTAGTVLVKDINTFDSQLNSLNIPACRFLAAVNNKLLFIANDSIHGDELWVTDGTNNGTNLLKDINPYPNFNDGHGLFTNSAHIVYNNQLYFTANDSVHGLELWVSDGTPQGTQMVIDLNTYLGWPQFASYNSGPTGFTIFNNELYFVAAHPAGYGNGLLFKTNGLANGTQFLGDDSVNFSPRLIGQVGNKLFTEMGGKLYFKGTTFNNLIGSGCELWVTDGTLVGTRVVKDIIPGVKGGLPDAVLGEIAKVNNKLVFSASDILPNASAFDGYELWVSDGTDAGTAPLKETYTMGVNTFSPKYFTEYKNRLYFNAWSDFNTETLWVTDGTTAGTYLYKDTILPMKGVPIIYNDRLYLRSYENLWETEGDSLSMRIVRPLNDTNTALRTSISSSNIQVYNDYVEYNGSLIFSADYLSNGYQPWKLTTTPLSIVSYDKKKLDFTLYPNPAKSIINISLADRLESTQIFDLNGRMVLQGSDKQVNVSSLSNGFYILKIYTNEGVGTAKFQVNR